MLNPQHLVFPDTEPHRPWDARLARRMVAPLIDSWVTPNHLTTLRLGVGLAAAAAFTPGSYGWSKLARMSGKTSRFGHIYDLACDAIVTILLFVAIGVGVGAKGGVDLSVPPAILGAVAGTAIALIFFLRMRIEDSHGKAATRQASLGGFETEDVLYLLPLATLSNALTPLLVAAAICAPVYAIWVVIDYRRVVRRDRRMAAGISR
jgi:phosphatidylglycerophosphate synthase